MSAPAVHSDTRRTATSADRAAAFWRRLGYELSGLPVAVASFAVVLAATIVGVVVSWTVIGIAALAIALRIAGGFASLERRRLGWLEGSVPPAYYRRTRGGVLRQSWQTIADPQRWRDVLHALLVFPIRIVTFVLSVVIPFAGLSGTLYVFWSWSLPRDNPDNYTLAELMGLGSTHLADVVVTTTIGVLLLVAAPFVVWGLASMDAGLARLLLCDENAGLRARVDLLAATRAGAVDAEAQTLRKVERDIHDGPQQRLVRLTMDLQSAQRRMADDPAAAESLVGEALQQAKDALDELRAVSRGIAPPILADRGLAAALAAAAARAPLPVTLDVRLAPDERLAPAIENALYYIVVESLTNIAKHSGASSCTVVVEHDDSAAPAGSVRVWVVDDGSGGAHVGKGHGLAGLVDRAAALDGRVSVDSPAGGPTVVFAELPVARD